MPYALYKENNNNVNWKEKVWNFFNFYNTNFVLAKDKPAELDFWERYWTKEFKGNHPTTVDAISELNPYSYPSVFEALKIIAVFHLHHVLVTDRYHL